MCYVPILVKNVSFKGTQPATKEAAKKCVEMAVRQAAADANISLVDGPVLLDVLAYAPFTIEEYDPNGKSNCLQFKCGIPTELALLAWNGGSGVLNEDIGEWTCKEGSGNFLKSLETQLGQNLLIAPIFYQVRQFEPRIMKLTINETRINLPKNAKAEDSVYNEELVTAACYGLGCFLQLAKVSRVAEMKVCVQIHEHLLEHGLPVKEVFAVPTIMAPETVKVGALMSARGRGPEKRFPTNAEGTSPVHNGLFVLLQDEDGALDVEQILYAAKTRDLELSELFESGGVEITLPLKVTPLHAAGKGDVHAMTLMSKHNTPSDLGSKMGLDDTTAGVVVIEMPGGHIARNQGRAVPTNQAYWINVAKTCDWVNSRNSLTIFRSKLANSITTNLRLCRVKDTVYNSWCEKNGDIKVEVQLDRPPHAEWTGTKFFIYTVTVEETQIVGHLLNHGLMTNADDMTDSVLPSSIKTLALLPSEAYALNWIALLRVTSVNKVAVDSQTKELRIGIMTRVPFLEDDLINAKKYH